MFKKAGQRGRRGCGDCGVRFSVRRRETHDREQSWRPFSTSCHLAVGVIGAADQWPGFDVAEAEGESFRFEGGKFIRMVVTGHGQMLLRGAEVLPDRHDIASDRA